MTATRDVLALRVTGLWHFFWAQDFAFWATCSYLVIEYVRPQQLISVLNNVPVGIIVLVAATLAYVAKGRWFALKGIGSALLLLYTAVIVVSSLAAFSPTTAVDDWRLWLSWLVVYFLIINVVTTEQRFAFFTLVWLFCHYYMSQGAARQYALRGFAYDQYGVMGAPGWFSNSGEFGIAMCLFLPVAWHYYLAARPHLTAWRQALVLGMPATAILGIMGSSSRGSVLGMAAVGVWSLLRGKHRVRMAVGVALLSAGVWLVLPAEFRNRFTTAGEDYTSQTRKVYWKRGLDMASRHPLLGVGYSNWVVYYRSHYVDSRLSARDPLARVQVSHNIFIQCVSELGYLGLAVFLALIFATLYINHRTRTIARAGPGPPNDFLRQMAYGLDGAMIGYLVSGFFVTVLYYPFFWVNLAFTVALAAIGRRYQYERRISATGRLVPTPGAQRP